MKKFKALPKWLRITILAVLGAAVLGGGVYGILVAVRSNSGAVNVYPVGELLTDYSADNAETQGPVTTDKIQSVYISDTQQVTEVYVQEGDEVKIGDELLAFDTTLTDLELERKGIQVQQLKLDLENAQKNLAIIGTYRVYVAPADPGPGEDPVLIPLALPYLLSGSGTGEDPYIYIWNDDCVYSESFINAILPLLPEGFVPGADPIPSVTAVFQVRTGDAVQGGVERSWQMTFRRNDTGTCEYTITEPTGTVTEDDIEEGEILPEDPGGTYTWAELVSMRAAAEKKITELELDIKKAELEYQTLEYELTNGVVLSKIDGVVKTVRDTETALAEGKPLVLVSGGGGYYITGLMSELELETMAVGDTVNVMSWESGVNAQAQITEISPYPDSGENGGYHYSQGNNNVTLYPFTVFLDEDAQLREGEWVNLSYNPYGSTPTGLFLQNPFILTESGRSYIYVQNGEERLEKREIITGRSLWGSFTEVRGGLSAEDYIAFPYGRSVKDGARAKQANINELYSYY